MRGDRAGFERFFRQDQQALLRYCWGLTLDREAARDVAQESMTRAWREWDRIAGTNPAAWVRTVALNLVRSRQRHGRVVERAALACPPESAPDPAVDPDLVRALRSLPERQREAVVLHHLADLPVEECAARMGVGVPTVKIHLRRGRTALERLLRPVDTEVSGGRRAR